MKIKGMDKNMCCRGYQFEIGKEYKIDTNGRALKLCSSTVFHYCNSLSHVHNFYDVRDDNHRFFEIEVLGEEVSDDEKCGSNHIRIVREITGAELEALKNTGDGNTGLFNSGNCNSGYRNSGDCNSGNWNSGDRNSGVANKCNYSNGVFCNQEDMNIRIFNQPSGMSLRDWYRSRYWEAMCSAPFVTTEWIYYTDNEKKADPEKERVGGRLKVYTMKEAWANWWAKLSDDAKKVIQEIPNFDPEIFKDITGIEV